MIKNSIKKLEKEIERLKNLAYKDELTGLYNRRGFKEEIFKFIKETLEAKKFKSQRKSVIISNFSLVVFDIDNFKKLNDVYGHEAGDAAIKNLAKIASARVRAMDAVARWGGEEFILGLVGANESDAFQIAEDIREKIENSEVKWRGKKISFTVSGGAADIQKFKDFEDLFVAADKALYKAKKSGKNRIVSASTADAPKRRKV